MWPKVQHFEVALPCLVILTLEGQRSRAVARFESLLGLCRYEPSNLNVSLYTQIFMPATLRSPSSYSDSSAELDSKFVRSDTIPEETVTHKELDWRVYDALLRDLSHWSSQSQARGGLLLTCIKVIEVTDNQNTVRVESLCPDVHKSQNGRCTMYIGNRARP